MVYKGIVSNIEATGTRIILPDKENTVSAPLSKVSSVGELQVGNKVVVVFFSADLSDGVILGKY